MAAPSRASADWAEAADAVRLAGELLAGHRRRGGLGDATAFTLGILVGSGVGAVVAFLTAPVEGSSLRARIRESLAMARNRRAIVPAPESAPATITLTTVRPVTRP